MTVTIGRRELLAALGGAVAAWPRAARGQQPERLRRIGVLMAWPESDPEAQSEVASFVQELQKLGWTEGRDLRIDTRWWIPTDQESTHRFAKELVSLRPDVILSQGTSTTAALLRETRTIPIVFTVVADPIGSGFVASLARPGGNTTARIGALFVGNDFLFNSRMEQVTALAARYAIPTMYSYREFVVAGGLISYGTSLIEQYRQIGLYAGRILKGEKPADLPVIQATKIGLTINLKTAKTLGLEVPATLLALADEVIE